MLPTKVESILKVEILNKELRSSFLCFVIFFSCISFFSSIFFSAVAEKAFESIKDPAKCIFDHCQRIPRICFFVSRSCFLRIIVVLDGRNIASSDPLAPSWLNFSTNYIVTFKNFSFWCFFCCFSIFVEIACDLHCYLQWVSE